MASSAVFCNNCGAANSPEAAFCSHCGQSLQVSATESVSSSATEHSQTERQGTLLQQRYRILAQLGTGGFGAVYKAADTMLGDRLVAIKEMSQSGLRPQEAAEATEGFKREALMLANLFHPHLPRIYDQFSDGGHWYLVMDFIKGETLEEYLQNVGASRAGAHRHLSIEEVLNIGIQLCEVLDYLHTRQPPIIFRDLKPANIMLTPDGNIYLLDFGIARHFKPGQSKDTTALGSPGYAAPEQYGKAQTTPQADIYGLGATLHQFLSGSDPSLTPFQFAPLHLRGHQGAMNWATTELEALIMQMLDMNMSKRPASIAVVKQELQRIRALQSTGPVGVLRQRVLPPRQPPEFPMQSVPSYGSARQIQMPPPPVPARQGISRRRVILVLVGLVVGGGIIRQVFSQRSYVDTSVQVNPPPAQGFPIDTNYTSWVFAVAWSQNGKRLILAYGNGIVQIKDALGGNDHLIYRGHSDAVAAAAWSPDGKRIASGSFDTTVQVWDASTAQTIYTYRGHSGQVSTVAWSPDGARIASGSYDTTAQVWDATTGDNVLTYREHSAPVLDIAWSPNGKLIATASFDHTAQVWDAATANAIYTYSGHSQQVTSVAWSPDGKRIASGSGDATAQVWDATTGENAVTYTGHSDIVEAVAWSPDGKRIASASNDMTVQVWNAAAGTNVYTYRGHSSAVITVAWSPDGKHLASGDANGNTLVWKPR